VLSTCFFSISNADDRGSSCLSTPKLAMSDGIQYKTFYFSLCIHFAFRDENSFRVGRTLPPNRARRFSYRTLFLHCLRCFEESSLSEGQGSSVHCPYRWPRKYREGDHYASSNTPWDMMPDFPKGFANCLKNDNALSALSWELGERERPGINSECNTV
jgi:hypothetical protein